MDRTDIEDLFSGLGAVTIKRLFGGKGVYFRGLIIAIDWHDQLLLKGDAVTAPQLEAAGATRWSYDGKTGKRVNMPYWTLPEAALDDPDVMTDWLRLAYDAALRSTTV